MTTPIKPFLGIPQEGLAFLQALGENNQKSWFEAHKKQYITHLLRPAQSLVISLGKRLQKIDPNLQYDNRANGAGSIYRIYRDLRFSKDKRPYKTHLDIAFWIGEKKSASPSIFGVRIAPKGGMVMVGNYRFDPTLKQKFQQAAAEEERGSQLAAILQNIKEAGNTIEGDQYKRVPRGFDADHPRGDLLRYKSLYALSPTIPPEEMTKINLVNISLEHCQTMAPLHRWLVQAAG